PLEAEAAWGRPGPLDSILIPSPKQFLLSHGHVTLAPRPGPPTPWVYRGHKREGWPGAPLEPETDGLHDAIGPASYAQREDSHDETWDREKRIV
ncbi:hypothetical protein, partial [Acinetobacter pittii]|uniref:hypothetical protein n=1 Tax=Acinetobacter pittii TaxID=48296 RepID=UPI001BDB967B